MKQGDGLTKKTPPTPVFPLQLPTEIVSAIQSRPKSVLASRCYVGAVMEERSSRFLEPGAAHIYSLRKSREAAGFSGRVPVEMKGAGGR